MSKAPTAAGGGRLALSRATGSLTGDRPRAVRRRVVVGDGNAIARPPRPTPPCRFGHPAPSSSTPTRRSHEGRYGTEEERLRIFTYAALVARRTWAKKGLLLGSLLGATLVTALLAIVPLYEASIAAVDLLFSFREAPTSQVDMRALASAVPYDAAVATSNRMMVEEALTEVAPWYPTYLERTRSRELVFIPLDGATDHLAVASAWRQQAEAWANQMEAAGADAGLPSAELIAAAVAGSLPAEVTGRDLPVVPEPPYPTPSPEPTVSNLFTARDIAAHLDIQAGAWPTEPSTGELRVVLGTDLARRAGLTVGDRTILRPHVSTAATFEVVEVAAVASAAVPEEALWEGVRPNDLIFVTPVDFDRWTTPTPSDPATDPWLRLRRGIGPINAAQSWLFPIDREAVTLETVDRLSREVNVFSLGLGRSGIAVSTAVPDLIAGFDLRSVVFGGPILAMLALVVAGALYYLIYTAALTLEREAPEQALLRSRGASAWQSVGIHLAQSALVAVLAAVAAPLVARVMVQLTGLIPPMSDLTGGEPLRVARDRPLLPFVTGGAVLAFVSMGLAILPMARRSVLELRLLAARPSDVSFWQRYYVDVFLVALSAILLFQLRRRGLVETSPGDPGLDPLAVASPALFLFAGALVLLRLLPYVLRVLGWLLTRLRGMFAALPGWHLGRNPVPYGRLALLIWLTTGFGAFALTYAQTLDASYLDRAAFAAGSDVRVVGEAIGFADAGDGIRAAAVLRTKGNPLRVARQSELLAVRPDEFAAVVAWRDDFGPSPTEVLAPLRPDGTAPDWGTELPAGSSALAFEAVQVPESWARQQNRLATGDTAPPPLRLVVRVVDDAARMWTFASDELPTDHWASVDLPLTPSSALEDAGSARMVEPLSIQSIWLERRTTPGDPAPTSGETVLIAAVTARTVAGDVDLLEEIGTVLQPQAGLAVATVPGDTAAQAFFREVPEGALPATDAVIAGSPLFRDGSVTSWQVPVRTVASPTAHLRRPLEPLRILADDAALDLSGLGIGDLAQFGIESATVPGRVVGRIGPIPTAVDRTTTGVLIADLDGLMNWLDGTPTWALRGTTMRVAPQELWIATDDPDGAVRRVTAGIDEEFDVITARGAEAAFSSRPVQIGLVSILFVGAATGVLLALAGVTGYVLVAVQRRTGEMGVLRALGLRRGEVGATFAIEQLVVMVLGAVIGVGAGVGLMRLLIPFLQLGEEGEELVPRVLLSIDGGVLALYLALVAGLLVASVLWAVRRVSARDLGEVLREGAH